MEQMSMGRDKASMQGAMHEGGQVAAREVLAKSILAAIQSGNITKEEILEILKAEQVGETSH